MIRNSQIVWMERNFTFWFFVVPCAVCSLAWCAHCAVRSTPSTPTPPNAPQHKLAELTKTREVH